MANRPHLFLNNPRGQKLQFNASRKIPNQKIEDKAPEIYRQQKQRLARDLVNFNDQIVVRREQRTLVIPAHLEFIEVHFFAIFNDNDKFKTKTRFKNFGLSPVIYRNFNQSVLFAITDHDKFEGFIALLQDYINSEDDQTPKNTTWALATIINDFELLSTSKITGFYGEDIIVSLVTRGNEIKKDYDKILSALMEHLDQLRLDRSIDNYISDEHSTIEIRKITREAVDTLIKNFDVIYKVQSLRVPAIRANELNIPELTWNLTINPPENDVVIGVLDNGVRAIAPLSNILVDSDLDLTNRNNPNPTQATRTHGTVVASLAAVGLDLLNGQQQSYTADARIMPIKILDFDTGTFNIYDIERVIRRAHREGVRIFNLSVCGPSLSYNATVSEYAYLLDKLTYNLDILIFIAAGNLDEQDIAVMNDPENAHEIHRYPSHFYNPHRSSDLHVCEAMNICQPAESFNNITVGALADNGRVGGRPHLTPFKEMPAYYTRKHYINPLARINGTNFQDSQRNRNINKPDIVMPGGDRLNDQAGMQVLGFGMNGNDYYNFDSGTSLATPLAANLAAKILGAYSNLTMQSVKALILNSAQLTSDESFLNELEQQIKEDESQKFFGVPFRELTKKQRQTIQPKFNAKTLLRNLAGYGMPQLEKAIFSEDKAVTLVVQDVITVKTYKVININIPEYLLRFTKTTPLIQIEATLCYKFYPVWGNQLAYNPLHISFNFVNTNLVDNPSETAAILSDTNHAYFDDYYLPGMDPEKKAKARKRALGIKSDLQSWSEDFFPPSNKPFSNTQHLSLQVNKEEIAKTARQISLAIRCTHKTDLEKELLDYLVQSGHEFSIVLRLTEKDNLELADHNLYDELISCNTLIAVPDVRLDNDLEASLEI